MCYNRLSINQFDYYYNWINKIGKASEKLRQFKQETFPCGKDFNIITNDYVLTEPDMCYNWLSINKFDYYYNWRNKIGQASEKLRQLKQEMFPCGKDIIT